MEEEYKIGVRKIISLDCLGGIKLGEKIEDIEFKLSDNFLQFFFICDHCGYGKEGEILYWYHSNVEYLGITYSIVICFNCEKVISAKELYSKGENPRL